MYCNRKKIFVTETRDEQHRGASGVIFLKIYMREPIYMEWVRIECLLCVILKTFHFLSVCEFTLFYTLQTKT